MTENCALPGSAAPTLNSIQLRYSSIIRLIKKYHRVAQSVSVRVVRGPRRLISLYRPLVRFSRDTLSPYDLSPSFSCRSPCDTNISSDRLDHRGNGTRCVA